jgi:membrane protease YdiL (CAAX protease family)
VELLLSGVLSLGSVAYFCRLAAESDSQSRSKAMDQAYTMADVMFTSTLVLWFLMNAFGFDNSAVELNARILIITVILTLFLVAIVLSFLVLRHRNPLELFGLRGVSPARNLKAAGVGLAAALPVVYFIHTLCLLLLGADAEPQPVIRFLARNSSLQDRLLLVGTALVVAPAAEELIFRGYIFGVFRRYTGRWWAMVTSALIFAAFHAHIPSLAGLFAFAVALTLVYEGTGSLWASILMHSFFNGITVVFTLARPDLVK